MAKFFGVIGYGNTIDQGDGVWEVQITERQYYGDIVRNARRFSEADGVTGDISLTNSISIVADAYANEHFFAIRYVKWAGARWTVSEVEVQRPRLLLRLGGVYNGPTPE